MSDQRNPQSSSSSGAKQSRKRARGKKSQAKKPRGVDKGTQTIVPPVLTEFTLFPNLPLEIRRQIWRSTFESRKVGLQSGAVGMTPPNQPRPPNYPFELPAKDHFLYGPPFPAPINHLPVAFVNRESRVETLSHYVRLFQDLHSSEKDGTDLKYPATIYFNPTLDVPKIFANKTQYAFNKMNLACQRLFPSYDSRAVEMLKSVRTVELVFMGFCTSDRWSFDMDACRDTFLMFENLEMIRVTDAIIHFDLNLLRGRNLDDNFNPNSPLGVAFRVDSLVRQYFGRPENYPSVNGNSITLLFNPGMILGPVDT
ncbi:hypothetical protein BTUL_0039g00640 [Botrytis tulipae]|uniref:2EXR domain-containing protein n=1 Tax=Botrytis tulipae TaxID=87230 RepID=A0A4Z1F334_9HELO|nr:hypothetical protein BTUL_0039g00640 [Botrytis tulipae]